MSQEEIDVAIRNVFRDPPIVAGEDRAQYEALKKLVLKDLKPKGLHEMLLARDIVDAEWEHRRLRDLKAGMLHAAIPRVVKSQMAEAYDELSPLNGKIVPDVRKHVVNILAGDASAKQALETLLRDHHLTVDVIVAAAFADTIVPQLHTDRMTSAAYERRNATFAALERLRAGRQTPSRPAGETIMNETLDLEEGSHPGELDKTAGPPGAAGQAPSKNPDSLNGG
jgi:hypothetical protein